MRTIRKDSDMLVLRDWSWGIVFAIALPMSVCALMAWGYFNAGEIKGGIILSGISALLLVPLYSFARWTSAVFDRRSGVIRVLEVGLFLFRITRHPMQGLTGATTETHIIKPSPADRAGESNRRRRNRNRTTWRPVLLWADGRREPLLKAYGEQMRAGMAASAVNAWVRAPAARK